MSTSVQYINNEPWSHLFQVSPSQFNVTCQLQREEFLQLSIINSCNDCIAWKLKTNRPGRYMVSPKQGIILSKQRNECTVVLSKLKQVPDTKKPDKFLIQATKIDADTQPMQLAQLWKDRESKHNKKRRVYAYQSVTIKCFLNIDTKSKQNQKTTIIEDYVSSESVAQTPSKSVIKTQATRDINTPQYPPKAIDIETVNINTTETLNNDVMETDNDNNTETISKSTKTDTVQYNPQTVEKWKRKAQEYDELFQFTRKTLAQRDELNARCKSALEKARSFEKLNREMKEEKKHLLSKFNKYKSTHNADNMDDDEDEYEDEDEEKQEIMTDNTSFTLSSRARIKEKNECIREMNEIEKQAVRNSSSGCTISIVHIVITILLMYVAFIAGKHSTGVISEIDDIDDHDHVMEHTEKHEI